jgi:chemotaxis protein methyltransferase CheR
MSNQKYISSDNLNWFVNKLQKETGIIISKEKTYLIETRLYPITKKNNYKNIDEVLTKIRKGLYRNLMQEVFDSMTTNETSFFRDKRPFEIFEEVSIPELIEKNKRTKKLKIWSAACSSGQEAYSLAMILDRNPLIRSWDIKIIATDISQTIINKAKQGIYSQFEVQRGIPTKDLLKYFYKEGKDWVVKDFLKKNIQFEVGNIFHPRSYIRNFDVVFCRNALIYFDKEDKQKAIDNISYSLVQNGHFYIGGAETILGKSDSLKLRKEHHGLYTKI